MFAWVYVPWVPWNSWVIGFLTFMFFTCSSSTGRESRLRRVSLLYPPHRWKVGAVPFLWWNNFNDPRLHAVLVDLVDKGFEASELFHGLHTVL